MGQEARQASGKEGMSGITEALLAELEDLKRENERLNIVLGRRQLERSDRSWLDGYRAGVAEEFDMLGERKDERVMVLVQRQEAELKRG
jgi:hypothetical protein